MSPRSKRQRGARRRSRAAAPERKQSAAPTTADSPAELLGSPAGNRAFDEERLLWRLREELLAEPTRSREELLRAALADRTALLAPDAPLPTEPRARARELAFRAAEQADDATAAELATRALRSDPLNTDAHLTLLRLSELPLEEQLDPLATILSAARDLLGEPALTEARGGLWRDCRARPYLRAAAALAAVTARAGHLEQAADLYAHLASLDSSNHFLQAQRATLLNLALERDTAASDLLAGLADDPRPATRWAQAFAAALATDSPAPLRAAADADPRVLALASGRTPFPDSLDITPEPGSPEESALTADVLLETLEHSPRVAAAWNALHP